MADPVYGFENSVGVDVGSLFKARTSTAIANTGYEDSAGVDLAQRFEPRAGSPIIAQPTGYQISNGTDLQDLFMDINHNPLPDILWGGLAAILDSDSDAFAAAAGLTLKRDGTYVEIGDGTTGNWTDNAPTTDAGDDFECRYVYFSGVVPVGNTNWETISGDKVFRVASSSGSKSGTFDVEIRPIGNSGAMETRRVTATANHTGGGGIIE